MNLRERLRRIRKAEPSKTRAACEPAERGGESPAPTGFPASANFPAAWLPAGHQTLRRAVYLDFAPALPRVLPRALRILIPDIARHIPEDEIPPQDALFFDLETTGLSGGAGTVAFLAAVGRFVPDEMSFRLRVDQYLLLDYPGESAFLNAVCAQFAAQFAAHFAPPQTAPSAARVVVTYNGKTFDAPLLKTRCLMQGIAPPEFACHADLLHLSRRLWKRVAPNCSQGEIEKSILGIERRGDMPGALAPEAWFAFLRTGKTDDLARICDHNIRDIAGLAHLFAAAVRLAETPAQTAQDLSCDIESLALQWRKMLPRVCGGAAWDASAVTAGERLLARAAGAGHPRALLLLARDRLREARREEGLACLARITGSGAPAPLKAAAYRQIAIDAERHGDRAGALAATEAALALNGLSPSTRGDLERRRGRLKADR